MTILKILINGINKTDLKKEFFYVISIKVQPNKIINQGFGAEITGIIPIERTFFKNIYAI